MLGFGQFGGIVINGPASADYDEDMGVIFLNGTVSISTLKGIRMSFDSQISADVVSFTDWSHETADELYESAQTNGPPTLDNGLINGTNVYGDDGSSSRTGSRFEVSVTSGTSYRIRLINGAIDTHFKWSIDNHTMTVIASDLVPIVPYDTTVLNIAIGKLSCCI